MKNLKFTFLAFLTVFVTSCQKEELDGIKNQESKSNILNIPENFKLPVPTTKMYSQDFGFNVYDSPVNTTYCSPIQVVNYNNLSGFNLNLGETQSYNFAGGYITIDNGGILNIKATTIDGSVVYEENFTSGERFYWGFSSSTNLFVVARPTSTISLESFALAKCDFTTDTDGDGCADAIDSAVSSNFEETIILHQCDSKVVNRKTLNCGVMMSDLIDRLEIGTYRNHGGFVKEVAHLADIWVNQGLITVEEKNAITSCAGSSN